MLPNERLLFCCAGLKKRTTKIIVKIVIEQLWKIAKKLGWELNISFEGSQKDNYSVGYAADNQLVGKMSLDNIEAVG